MSSILSKESKGAWIVHHGRKVWFDVSGPAEFPILDEAAKAAHLLTRLGASDQSTLTNEQVTALAVAARINPRHELSHLLGVLESRRLIQRNRTEVEVLGITTLGVLGNAADIFDSSEPSLMEQASIDLAEKASSQPILIDEITEYISDIHRMTGADASQFIEKAENVGFIDVEGSGSGRLVFNGNLFRHGDVEKSKKILDALTADERIKLLGFEETLKQRGCVEKTEAVAILGGNLFDRLRAASYCDVNRISNDEGIHVYVTLPGAFHKFVSPLVDDSFDMAKALVSAIAYGMTRRKSTDGRIISASWILKALIRGDEIGPAPAIGQDYRVLEEKRVVQIRRQGNRFFMKLKKIDVGELALQVLSNGTSEAAVLNGHLSAPMSSYTGPEESRVNLRRKQSPLSKNATLDILHALRTGGAL